MSDLTEIGKLKQALNNKIDRDFYNNNREAFDHEVSETETVQNTQAHFSTKNKSDINAKTGWIHYDPENDVLEIKKQDGEWREVGGSSAELKGKIDVLRCKETTITDSSVPLEIELDEGYPASTDNLQVFVDGKIIDSGYIKISSNGLKLTISTDALVQDASVKVQYMNYVPRSTVRAGIQMLGQICDTQVSGYLESGAVYADGYVYERTEDGDFKYSLADENDKSKWLSTEDFSEELYTKLRFANRNEIDETEHPEYETLLNDERSNYIDAISFEHWSEDENKIYFALDPSRHRYIVPEISTDIASLKKYVVVKSIYNDIVAIGKSALSTDRVIRENVAKLNTYLDSSSNNIVENTSTVKFKQVGNNFVLLGPTKLFYPNGMTGEYKDYSSTVISTKITSYLTLDVSSVDDGEYLVLLNKIGENSTRYKVKYISPKQFYITDSSTEKTDGAYLYNDNSKIEVYTSGTKDDSYYSMPVCKIKVADHSITSINNSNNIYFINNGIVFGAGIQVNVPLGFNDSGRLNTLCSFEAPSFIEIDSNTRSVYAELSDDDKIIVKKSDAELVYDFSTNIVSIGDVPTSASRLVEIINGAIVYPTYDKFYVQEKLQIDNEPTQYSKGLVTSGTIYENLISKADIFLENTGFISNGIIELPAEGLGSASDNIYTLNQGVEFLIANGLQENGRLKSRGVITTQNYTISLDSAIENGFIFYDFENDKLVVSTRYAKQQSEPEDPVDGTVWFNRNQNKLFRWDGSSWVEFKAIAVVEKLNTDENGKITSYQNINVLTSGEGGMSADTDNVTTKVNKNNQIEAIALKTELNNSFIKVEGPMTLDEYNSLEVKDPNTLYNVVDEYESITDSFALRDLSNITPGAIKQLDIDTKADKSEVYTKEEVYAKEEVYNKSEVDSRLGDIEKLLNDILTGTVTV